MDAIDIRPATRPLDATVTLPGSQSMTSRALIIAALADGTSTLDNICLADESHQMVDALRSFGMRIEIVLDDQRAIVTGCRGHIPLSDTDLFCRDSLLVMQCGAALAALGHGQFRFDGSARLRQCPIGQLVKSLQSIGALIEYEHDEDRLPFVVHARGMRGGTVHLDAPFSSRIASALLPVAPSARNDVFIEIDGRLDDRPPREILRMMADFGVAVIHENLRRFIIAAPQRYRGTRYTIEPDAADASHFLAAPAIAGGQVTVENLGTSSVQREVEFVDLLEQMGCRVERTPTSLTVRGPEADQRLEGIDADLNGMPDVSPTLAVLALFARGPSRIRNVAGPRPNQTDRLSQVAAELSRLGARVEIIEGGLSIHPPDRITPYRIDTHDDARMAMAFSLVGLAVSGIAIRDPQYTSKAFPDFFTRLRRLTEPPA